MTRPTDAQGATGDAPDRGLDALPGRVYRFRMLGMGLAGLPIAVVLAERDAAAWTWGFWLFTTLLWPQLALALARRSRTPYRTEVRSLLADSAIAGFWAPLMHFSLLPSVLIATLATVDKISTAIDGLWQRSILALGGAMLAGAVLTGFTFAPQTSMAAMLASVPLLLIHTIVVAMTSSRLVRKVRDKNRRLDELSRIDALTGAASRRSWQQQAEAVLEHYRATGEDAALMMVDVDHFKSVNDGSGHATGDDALRMVADAIRQAGSDGAITGRYGGDEFAVVVPGRDAAGARETAAAIVAAVAGARLEGLPSLRCSVSVGVATAEAHGHSLAHWTAAADAALYEAKQGGRGRAVFALEDRGEPGRETADDGERMAGPDARRQASRTES